ncbi:hypothetical protein QFC21_000733 [Naganishia friedmannii]|uniref:Uncharacterized protein n=1 Tax=Naganishia friedmannii TaxID=89922 RepID=A0ACC2W784_9TREE|nr:hypothetical protein QFC21_000733 [Naganishia friedmannii]
MPAFNQLSHRLASALPFLSRLFRVRPSRLPLLALSFIVIYTVYTLVAPTDTAGTGEGYLPTWLSGAEKPIVDAHLLNFDMYPDITRNGRKNAHIEEHLLPGHKSSEEGFDAEDIEDDQSSSGLIGNLANWFGSSTTDGDTKGGASKVKWEQDAVAQAHHQLGQLEFTPRDGLIRGWKFDRLKSSAGRPKSSSSLQAGTRTTHPIEILMAENSKRWNKFLARQSTTLAEAVAEYQRRYKRLPPKGFDRWWQYCVDNGVKIVDDYDQINHDIEPYLALSPEFFRERVRGLDGSQFTYSISVGPTIVPKIGGPRASATRAKQFLSLVSPLSDLLPTDITMVASDHDLGSWILGADQRSLAIGRVHTALDEAREEGKTGGLNNVRYLGGSELKHLENQNRNGITGWFSACDENSAARGRDRAMENRLREMEGLESLPEPASPAFVKDVRPGFDWCENPEIKKMHGTMSYDFARQTVLRPIFVLSKFMANNEFLFPPMEAYENATDLAAIKKFKPWSEKTINKLFWRGTSTGDSYSKRKGDPTYNWRSQHRTRLALMAQNKTGEAEVWVNRHGTWEPEYWNVQKLNDAYLDIGLTGKPHQCNQEDGTCDEMAAEIEFKDRVSPEKAADYKFDGNGWSSRFSRLLMSGSVVIKHTLFPEWHHPMQLDYSDLYNIMAFFAGTPDGRFKGRDDLAQKIAEQGRKFRLEHWRWEDMQAYMFRLLLEYARLGADDRDAFSYSLDDGVVMSDDMQGADVML